MSRRITDAELRDAELAREVARWIADEHAGRHLIAAGAPVGNVADSVWQVFPAARQFGRPAIEAAAARVTGCCRWSTARLHANRLREPAPALTAAGRVLLGEPCGRCLRHMSGLVKRRVEASTTPERRRELTAAAARRRTTGATTRATTRRPHPAGDCQTCQVRQLGRSLVASGKGDAQLGHFVAAASRAHDPRPGPRVVGLRRSVSGSWHLRFAGQP